MARLCAVIRCRGSFQETPTFSQKRRNWDRRRRRSEPERRKKRGKTDGRTCRPENSTWGADWTANRKARSDSSTKCYNCGQFGHYKSDFPQRRKSNYTKRQPMRPSAIECRLSAGNHYMRECPELGTAKRLLSQKSVSNSDSKPTNLGTNLSPDDSTSAFKKDVTKFIYETEESPVQIINPAMPMSEESTHGTAKMQLFFVLGAVQSVPTWIFADSGSIQNLIDDAVYKKLPEQPPIRDPSDCRIIGGNGKALDLRLFAVRSVTLGTTLLCHEFKVVLNQPSSRSTDWCRCALKS